MTPEQTPIQIDVDLSKRNFMIAGGMAGLGALTLTTTACPFDKVTKAKAVKVAGFVIELSKEAVPLADVLGAHDIATLFSTKVIPALEKMKEALANADIATSNSTLETVRNALGDVATALFNLPDSPRRTTIIGILASVNILLMTVEAFIDSESPAVVATAMQSMVRGTARGVRRERILRTFEATRQ